MDLVGAGPIQMSNGGVYDICVRFDYGVAAPRAKVKVGIEELKPLLERVNPTRGALSNLQAHDLEQKRAAVSTQFETRCRVVT